MDVSDLISRSERIGRAVRTCRAIHDNAQKEIQSILDVVRSPLFASREFFLYRLENCTTPGSLIECSFSQVTEDIAHLEKLNITEEHLQKVWILTYNLSNGFKNDDYHSGV
jgi:hypothetical protein